MSRLAIRHSCRRQTRRGRVPYCCGDPGGSAVCASLTPHSAAHASERFNPFHFAEWLPRYHAFSEVNVRAHALRCEAHALWRAFKKTRTGGGFFFYFFLLLVIF